MLRSADIAGPFALVLDSPIGAVGVRVVAGRLTHIELLYNMAAPPLHRTSDPTALRARAQLRRYFADPGAGFSLPLGGCGTAFQRRVWKALQAIPAGETVTYGELAGRLGSSARAVGGACRSNPLPIVVPCHRVVARTGVGGFAGDQGGPKVEAKRWLLSHERRL